MGENSTANKLVNRPIPMTFEQIHILKLLKALEKASKWNWCRNCFVKLYCSKPRLNFLA